MGVDFCERELSWELQFQTQQTRASDHREDVHEPNALALDVPGVLPVLPEDRLQTFSGQCSSIPRRNVQCARGHHAVAVHGKSPSCPSAEAVTDGAIRIHPIGVDTLRSRDVLALAPAS